MTSAANRQCQWLAKPTNVDVYTAHHGGKLPPLFNPVKKKAKSEAKVGVCGH